MALHRQSYLMRKKGLTHRNIAALVDSGFLAVVPGDPDNERWWIADGDRPPVLDLLYRTTRPPSKWHKWARELWNAPRAAAVVEQKARAAQFFRAYYNNGGKR